MGEAALVESDLSQPPLTLYFALRIVIQRLSLLETIIHASLARKALLMSLDILNPRPLAPLGRQSFSQDFHARNFPSHSFGFHQNFLAKESSLSHTMVGTLKVDMV